MTKQLLRFPEQVNAEIYLPNSRGRYRLKSNLSTDIYWA